MYNRTVSLPLVAPLQQATLAPSLEGDCNKNRRIRDLLGRYGLRPSLIRLKVIDALLVAAREGRSIGVHGVHAHLGLLIAEVSYISVREVLKRLREEGVIDFHDKAYHFTPHAWAFLGQHTH
ncbi:fe2+ zn2+ uptake regulation protein [Pseudomonas sp. NPDC089569]|uniref:fe2+ zn2+ uptake regulation protein n=1 Tax=Pseudomonas sp. NPDC089569 TaxID=3390722 RepID=UPI003D06BC6D